MSLILPETENRTLEDIEEHFSDNTKNIIDRKIAKCTKFNGTAENVRCSNKISDPISRENDQTSTRTNADYQLRAACYDNETFEIESKV